MRDATTMCDTLALMMEQEATHPCRDYLRCVNSGRDDDTAEYDDDGGRQGITADDRMKIVDWCYDIVDRLQFQRETVAVAMKITDRFMSAVVMPEERGRSQRSSSRRSVVSCDEDVRDILYDRGQYQLLAITSLYISIKLNERVAFSSVDFSMACRFMYSQQDIEAMERTM